MRWFFGLQYLRHLWFILSFAQGWCSIQGLLQNSLARFKHDCFYRPPPWQCHCLAAVFCFVRPLKNLFEKLHLFSHQIFSVAVIIAHLASYTTYLWVWLGTESSARRLDSRASWCDPHFKHFVYWYLSIDLLVDSSRMNSSFQLIMWTRLQETARGLSYL